LACGGLLAWCASSGARVGLLCATRGEQGRGADDATIARIRAAELDAAAEMLGISEVFLLDYPDGELQWVDEGPRTGELTADILKAIRLLDADVVVTFGEDGLYWHPDHIAMHDRTTAAVRALANEAPALYYVTLPERAIRNVVDLAVSQSNSGASADMFGIDDPDAFGTLALPPTLVIDVGELALRKVAALKCHRSQIGDGALARISDADAAQLLRIEHFRRAPLACGREPFIEQLAAVS
jgi:LmbE family N-acetylglucosaminyl deacetylase